MKLNSFWLEGDNFILMTRFENGYQKHFKFYFRDSSLLTINDIDNPCLNISEELLNTSINFESLTFINNISYTFIVDTKSKYDFDFILIKKNGLIIQIIPFATKLSSILDCIKSYNHNLAGILENIMRRTNWK